MKYKIMIIEDDYNIASLLKDNLHKFNYDVYIINDFKRSSMNLKRKNLILLCWILIYQYVMVFIGVISYE